MVRVQRDLVATSRRRRRARRLHQMLLWLLAGLAALTCVALLASDDYRSTPRSWPAWSRCWSACWRGSHPRARQTAAAEREAALTAVLLDIARTTALDSDDPQWWAVAARAHRPGVRATRKSLSDRIALTGVGRCGGRPRSRPVPARAQISSGTIWIAPDGHSATHRPQPLQ